MVRVSEIVKNRGQIRVILDDGSSFLLLKTMYQERPLEVNQELDAEEFENWVSIRQFHPALEKAIAMLSVRARSKGEISQKLIRTGFSSGTIEMVLYKLEKEGFLNDQEFAGQWVQYRAEKKLGPRRITQELKMKGITAEEADHAILSLTDEMQLEDAVFLARKALNRIKSDEDIRKIRQKITTAIVRRGYDWDTARQACEQVMSEQKTRRNENQHL